MDINNLLKTNEPLIIQYFNIQKEAEKRFGKNTIVLMEVGSFYEIYEYNGIGKAKEVAKILNMILTRKNKNKELSQMNPYMCGFPSLSLDKNLQILQEQEKYTILLIEQEGIPPNITRKIKNILSPSINFSDKEEEQYLASIKIENYNGIEYGAISLIETSINKTKLFETFGSKDDPTLATDEILKIILSHNVKEFVFIGNYIEKLNPYQKPYIVYNEKDIKKYLKVSFQEEFLSTIFKKKGFLSTIESLDLERKPLAKDTLVILLYFILEHNKILLDNLKEPIEIKDNKYLYLGNNPLYQLDIFSFKKEITVEKIINKGITAIGKRYIKECLLNPLKDLSIIQKRLNLTEYFINKRDIIKPYLNEIYDIERLVRKLDIKNIQPFELLNLYNSILSILNISDLLEFKLKTTKYKQFIELMQKHFDIEKLNCNLNTPTLFLKTDNKNYQKNLNKKITIENQINTLKKSILSSLPNNIILSFKNYKEGSFIEISNKIDYKTLFKNYNYSVKKLKNSVKIYFHELRELEEKLLVVNTELLRLTKEIYLDILNNINFDFSEIIQYLCDVEFSLNNAYLYEYYKYNKPIIEKSLDNFYIAKDLRHPIVEVMAERGSFVSNTITLGNRKKLDIVNEEIMQEKDDIKGMLIYGINSAGKTVLVKSVGISVLLAQSGFYVPASYLRFSLKDSLFTRISGSDDLEKGLSTFAVEMIELKNIFNRATNSSIILGDEISHGTETYSGTAIIGATIKEFLKKDSLFLLSTHLHKLKDIVSDTRVSNTHLSIKYDEKRDLLIYDRKLKRGSGSALYGLEFCKSLKMSDSFLSEAYKIRKKFIEDLSEEELVLQSKESRYNKNVFLNKCALCNNKAVHTHHLQEQQFFDKKDFRKNKKNNLIGLCEECHKKIHIENLKLKFVDTENGTQLIFIDED